ncbi:MAG TPA: hypothetical protein VG271_18200, partial [Beijerinckiaceae bacterium]|nr:hypothetical protein [Beijerinckiaceae bacterium]
MIRCAWTMRGLVAPALWALVATAAFAQATDGHRPLTSAEQIYADLAKLDDATRAEKIEEGARKEGELDLASGFAGQIGIDHTKLFENRYPFLKVDRVEQGAEDGAQLFVTESSVGRRLTDVYTFSVASAGDVVRRDLSARYPTPMEKHVLPAYRGLLD